MRRNADGWRRIWFKLDGIGLGPTGVQFSKVKAHRTEAQLTRATPEERRIALANRGADSWAGEGAQQGTYELLGYIQQACKEEAAKVRFALNFQAKLATRVFAEHGAWLDVQPTPRRQRAARCHPLQLVPNEGQGHQPQKTGSGWKCARCGKRAQK